VKKQAEAELARAAQGDDREALSSLLERSRPWVLALAARLLGDPQVAEDAAQEVLAAAAECIGALRVPEKFGAWLTTITINECRQRSRRRSPIALPLDAVPEPSARIEAPRELGAVLAQAARRMLDLPERQATAAAWFYFRGATYAEIAGALDTTEVAVQSALQRARTRLRGLEADIENEGDAILDADPTDVESVVASGELLVRGLGLGEHRWGGNRMEMTARNRSDGVLDLGLDVRTCVSGGHGTNWQKQWRCALPPGEERRVAETYHISRILCPWYAVFRGPGVARIRVTLASCPKADADDPFTGSDRTVFRQWFEVIVPADPEARGVPVTPVLPESGDSELADAQPSSLTPGTHTLRLTLQNRTADVRPVGFLLSSPAYGSIAGPLRAAPGESEHTVEYVIYGDFEERAQAAGDAPQLEVIGLQFPLNLDELDIEDAPLFAFRYAREVPEATIGRRVFPLTIGS
jgi:RNA polymerase sigma-70 factor (ECF subfamily)